MFKLAHIFKIILLVYSGLFKPTNTGEPISIDISQEQYMKTSMIPQTEPMKQGLKVTEQCIKKKNK